MSSKKPLASFMSWLESSETRETEKLAANPSGKSAPKPGEEPVGKWWEIPDQVLTRETKRDLQIIQNRNYLDPKRFYKVRARMYHY